MASAGAQKSISRLLRVLLVVPLFIGFFASPASNTNHTVDQVLPRVLLM